MRRYRDLILGVGAFLLGLDFASVSAPRYELILTLAILFELLAIHFFGRAMKTATWWRPAAAVGIFVCLYVLTGAGLRLFFHVRLSELLFS